MEKRHQFFDITSLHDHSTSEAHNSPTSTTTQYLSLCPYIVRFPFTCPMLRTRTTERRKKKNKKRLTHWSIGTTCNAFGCCLRFFFIFLRWTAISFFLLFVLTQIRAQSVQCSSIHPAERLVLRHTFPGDAASQEEDRKSFFSFSALAHTSSKQGVADLDRRMDQEKHYPFKSR